ncbi:MAG: DUF2721 domain-containing protein [Kovacikia sp.]
MSVEQTTQLIQLILNSVLMTVVCALAWGRLGMRHAAAEEKLQTASHWYANLLEAENAPRTANNGVSPREVHSLQAKKTLRRLQRRYQVTHYSLLATHYALLFSIGSILTMALRALINVDWLIVAALGLFVIGVASLLLGVGLTLIDLHTSDRSLREEVQEMLTLTHVTAPLRPTSRGRSGKMVDRATRQSASKVKLPSSPVSPFMPVPKAR